ncbi:MAG: four helix bundle protein [Moorea sp. SIO1F2]|uniref:four helix bundle protein n=1 Tax=unclassified Moorena TaxID=2683338 RepID=UPI0013BB4A60|nr:MULTISPECIES: four helix bundle protein [unclassified Moorena]NEO07968.1 four helix bundle protein [Moorena sp. SIO3I8]NEO20124.1 four helix bundle protein [Moorena sp. SIO4A5]NEP20673.1 four helix bundle protein [Moorena sp. SIO3I6]NEQ57243.1 four helix bundle protein [Moorena sp. SIO4A1]NET85784.1 four helix bundle protein [Moorena sp. SIO1F2]
MSNYNQIQSYRDLRVWQKGMDVAESCYVITREFPKQEMYGMTAQIRRAAASIPANIAEGYGREYRGEYVQFLRIAQGSLKELETHLFLSVRVKLATSGSINPIIDECEALGRMLRSLIRSLLDNS